jgi:hypothetical protein
VHGVGAGDNIPSVCAVVGESLTPFIMKLNGFKFRTREIVFVLGVTENELSTAVSPYARAIAFKFTVTSFVYTVPFGAVIVNIQFLNRKKSLVLPVAGAHVAASPILNENGCHPIQ